MPDHRLAKCRASLPEGYQFGDAKVPTISLSRFAFEIAMAPLNHPGWDVICGVGYLREPSDLHAGEQ